MGVDSPITSGIPIAERLAAEERTRGVGAIDLTMARWSRSCGSRPLEEFVVRPKRRKSRVVRPRPRDHGTRALGDLRFVIMPRIEPG
jgi:hypothetical protein